MTVLGNGTHRDYYTELLEESRWMTPQQAAARTSWIRSLPMKNKDKLVFELEMTLKGVVCFGNPVNHPGKKIRGAPAAARDFTKELTLARDALHHVVTTGRLLGAPKDNASVFQRYRRSVIAQDQSRYDIVREALAQVTPDKSLALLVSTLHNLLDIIDGLSQSRGISYTLFRSLIQTVELKMLSSVFFNPLPALEFRPEFDSFTLEAQLDLVKGIESDPARRVASIAFLSMGRLLKYMDLIDASSADATRLGTLLAWFAALRSDTRALVVFLKRDMSEWIAEGFGQMYENLDLKAMSDNFDALESEFKRLKPLKKLLASFSDQLLWEQRKVFEQLLPDIRMIGERDAFDEQARQATDSLRTFVQNAVYLLAREFAPDLDGDALFENFVSQRARSERLRRDIWMFQQVMRAFIAKAKDAQGATDLWSGRNTFGFLREFVKYFRSMGYQILRCSDYEQFDRFMDLVDRLREGDALEVQRIPKLVSACEDFQEFLEETFQAVNKRKELADAAFDRKEAARTLKLLLTH